MGYIQQLRALVGHRPLIMVGAAVLIVDPQNRLLLQHRRDNFQWGLIGGSLEIGESLEECLSPPDKPILEQCLYSLT